jgi:hypothetical protein
MVAHLLLKHSVSRADVAMNIYVQAGVESVNKSHSTTCRVVLSRPKVAHLTERVYSPRRSAIAMNQKKRPHGRWFIPCGDG